ncbi:MAG: response regulator [Desulfobacter sp.]|nr:MAG: response regulator [Desulfobacter sp.]
MDKDICCLNFKGLFGYIEKRFGTEGVDAMLRHAMGDRTWLIPNKNNPASLEPVTLTHLTDEAYWVSNALSLALLGAIKKVVPGPHPEQRAGEAAVLENLSKRDLFFARVFGPMAVAKRAARINAKFNRTKDVAIVRVARDSAVVQLHYKPGVRVTREVCHWNLGVYMGVAKLSGARLLQARETKCVHEGHGCCEFEFNWQVPGFLSRFYRMGLRFLTKDLIAEYEKTVEDRDRLIERLTESETLFKRITGHTSALVSIHDDQGRYVYAGQSHIRMGYRPGELIGKSSLTMVEPEDRQAMTAALEAAKAGRQAKAFLNYRLRDKSGRCRYYRGAFDAVFRPSGALDQIICVGEDITALRQAESEKMAALTEAAESRKMALVGQVSGKMAHDFNNILTIIMGTAEINAIECNDPGAKKAFSLIFQQSRLGKTMTRNLVAFAKDQELKEEYFFLNDKCDLVLDLLGKDLKEIEVERHYSPDIGEIKADPGMIENALVNIIQNAIHALSRVAHPRIAISIRGEAGDSPRVCLEIEDNGCGIPERFQERIFDPSFTLKGSRDKSGAYAPEIKGTGYGMANVKKYVEQHKGRVSVWSKDDSGTRVTIELPTSGHSPCRCIAEEEPAEICASEKRILIVEDEEAISRIHRSLLSNSPGRHMVDIAETGDAALSLLDSHRYDLVSLDYVLPGNLDGMDLYTHIRKSDPDIPILFVSGNLEFIASVKELKQKDSCMAHLSKPFTNLEYFNAVNRLMAEDAA